MSLQPGHMDLNMRINRIYGCKLVKIACIEYNLKTDTKIWRWKCEMCGVEVNETQGKYPRFSITTDGNPNQEKMTCDEYITWKVHNS